MNDRYRARFDQLKKSGAKAFMPFTVLGWPDKAKSLNVIHCMIESGATALELGIPFSDPVADGPVIAKASFEALEKGFKTQDAFDLIFQVRKIDNSIPIGILVYYNVVLAHGLAQFFDHAKAAGIDGVLIADLPVESAHEVLPHARKAGIDLIFIVSPVTTDERLEKICSNAGGFIYLVSRLGVTGTDKSATKMDDLTHLIDRLHELTTLPVCAGFGVSNKATASKLLKLGADGVIVGSRVIELVRDHPSPEIELQKLFAELKDACTAR